jgi:hypothetical protein
MVMRKRSAAASGQSPVLDAGTPGVNLDTLSLPGDSAIRQPRVDLPVGEPARVSWNENATELTVTWGREVFQPMKFHAFEIGSFQLTVRVGDGETVQQAADRALDELEAIADREFERKSARFLDRTIRLDGIVRGAATGNGQR